MFLFNKRLNLHVPNELMSVMHYYEDTCVMGCCGIAALDLSPQRAVDGMMDHGLEWAERGLTALELLIETVLKHSGAVVSDQNGFGESWKSSAQAVAFLSSVKNSLSAAITQVRQEGLPEISCNKTSLE
jgi:hypothetical protein